MAKISYGYATYQFRKNEQDPVVDRIRTVFQDAHAKVQKVSADSNVSTGTISRWFNGKTRKPQYATVAAVMGALGYRSVWEPIPSKNRRRNAASMVRIEERIGV